jgi:glutamyl-tRNA synthetase
LIDQAHAYRCFCSPERLQALAIARKQAGLATDYDRTCAKIPVSESASRAAGGEAHVVRLKTPGQYPNFKDAVYGEIMFAENARAHSLGAFEDPILLKSDGLPTYHLANVVDDHFMRITHVCRATEWMPSTPKHVYLYNCFGWTPPTFVHVGLLQNIQRTKLSKRNGDVFVEQYREKGYLPEALNNFVALMGWSHEETSDVMSMQEMIGRFSIDRLTSGNTVVTFEKLEFLQKQHVRALFGNGGTKDKQIIDAVEKEVSIQFGDK